MTRSISFACTALLHFLVLGGAASAVSLGQVDTFSGSNDSWQRGATVFTNGPMGAGDGFLQPAGDGSGPGGRLVTFNQSQWAGDYLSAGIGGITADVMNASITTPLHLRLAFGDATHPGSGGTIGNWYASTNSVVIPPSSGWIPVFFPIAPSAMTQVVGAASYNDVLSAVSTLRLLHSAAPSANGDVIDAALGVDNVTAVVPEPSSFLLGALASFSLLGLRRNR